MKVLYSILSLATSYLTLDNFGDAMIGIAIMPIDMMNVVTKVYII